MGDPFEPEDGMDALGASRRKQIMGGDQGKLGVDEPTPGIGTQVRMLLKREIINIRRNTTAMKARFMLTTFLSLLIGCIFYNVGEKDRSDMTNVQSQFGGLLMVLFMSMFATAMPSLLAFPEERPVFLREYSTHHYSVVSYFVTRLTVEAFITALQVLVMIVITYYLIAFEGSFGIFYATAYTLAMGSTALGVTVGCAVENPHIATEFLPVLFVPQMLLAGFFVTPDLIPVWLRWARYIYPLAYAVRILLVGEFETCVNEQEEENSAPVCNKLLSKVEAYSDDTWWYWIVLVALFAFFRLLALNILRTKATKFY